MIPLVVWTDKGLYCPAGDFYVDPSRGVDRAVVTHAHSDHARRGSRQYYCASKSVGLLKCRLGEKIQVQGLAYGEQILFNDVQVSLHPAGHMLGSSQVRIQRGNEVWVASGDYKREPDPTCEPFEVVPCDTFITEATFGTPSFVWNKLESAGREIFAWWQKNAEAGRNSLIFGYSLGKAQRILGELLPHFGDRRVLIHETIVEGTRYYREEGVPLAHTVCLNELGESEPIRGELILAPPSVERSEWVQRLGRYATAFASGWMQGGNSAHGRRYDHGFVLSDHADWLDLNRTIRETGARHIYVQHRGNGALVRHLREAGIRADSIEALKYSPASAAETKTDAKKRGQQLSLF